LRKEEQGDIGEDWVKYCSVNNIILSNIRWNTLGRSEYNIL
jgi:hypothetical protein